MKNWRKYYTWKHIHESICSPDETSETA